MAGNIDRLNPSLLRWWTLSLAPPTRPLRQPIPNITRTEHKDSKIIWSIRSISDLYLRTLDVLFGSWTCTVTHDSYGFILGKILDFGISVSTYMATYSRLGKDV